MKKSKFTEAQIVFAVNCLIVIINNPNQINFSANKIGDINYVSTSPYWVIFSLLVNGE